ncbi:MAG: hypothetical protein JOZ99_03640, partial [Actinobacteria bacterium]|nr:hypothetical protein [Actinomycetota bacterium]
MSRRSEDATAVEMTPLRAGRLAALLYLVCGPMVAVGTVALPRLKAENRPWLFLLALVAVASGTVIWFIPWQRFGRRSTLWLLPPTFAIIAGFDGLAGRQSYAYGVFFFVSFAWIGLTHRPGTALRFVPLAVFAYVVPLVLEYQPGTALVTITYVAPCWALVGETVAFVSDRLMRSQDLLRERVAGQQALFVNSPHPLFVHDLATGRFLAVNEA